MEKLNFEIEQSDIVDENPDSQFATAKVRAFSSGVSRNDTFCSEEVLQNTAHTIFNKPILYNISNMFGDFSSHSDPDRSLIAGFVVPDSASFERLPDERLSLSVLIKLWKRYSPKAMEIFKRDGGKKKVSVEVDLLDGEERPDGIKEMRDFVYSGICILGDLVQEASPGAGLEMMSFAKENEEYKKAVKLEFGKYEDIDFTIPENIRKTVNSGLDLYRDQNKGATSVSLASARFISKNEKITPEKIRHITKIFKSGKFKDMVKNPPSDEYITYLLYGGSEGMNWANDILTMIEDQDRKQMTYFSEEMTFPYKSLDDINPSLKGMDPPISLSQANTIASQADAIGSDEKKNGWAIAISNFKDSHIVKDGKWVKKEKNNMEDNEKKEEMELKKPQEEMSSSPPEEDVEKKNMAEGKEVSDKEKEDSKEDEKEDKEEEKEKKLEKKNMSLDQNLDVAAILAMLGDETEAYRKLVAEEFAKPQEEINYPSVVSAMYSKMCSMTEDAKLYAEKNEELKNFKLNVEQKEFNFQVESTMKDIEENSSMPQDKRDFLLEESKKYNLETINIWNNLARSEAFTFAKKETEEDDKTLRFSNPWATEESNKKRSIWND